jgi:hypothetical protein
MAALSGSEAKAPGFAGGWLLSLKSTRTVLIAGHSDSPTPSNRNRCVVSRWLHGTLYCYQFFLLESIKLIVECGASWYHVYDHQITLVSQNGSVNAPGLPSVIGPR